MELYKDTNSSDKQEHTPFVLTVSGLAHALHIGTTMAYALVRSGKIHSVKVGRVYRIPFKAVEEYLNKIN